MKLKLLCEAVRRQRTYLKPVLLASMNPFSTSKGRRICWLQYKNVLPLYILQEPLNTAKTRVLRTRKLHFLLVFKKWFALIWHVQELALRLNLNQASGISYIWQEFGVLEKILFRALLRRMNFSYSNRPCCKESVP